MKMAERKEKQRDEPLHKYDHSDLRDPLVRCYACGKLVHQQFINKHAGCNHCGNKRFYFVYTITGEEMDALKTSTYPLDIGDYQIDPEYIAIFKGVQP